jgi:hypothetical protein
MKDRKILDYIKNVDYDSLPQSYKDLRQQLTDVGKQYDKLKRDKKKLNDKLQIIYKDQKSISKKYTKLYKSLEFMNKSYSPKCYVIEYPKDKPTFLNCRIVTSPPTTIYLGKIDVVINKLQPHINNLTNKNFKTKINDFIKIKISEIIDYNNPNWLDKNKVNLDTILSTMDKVK